jgi:hemerythrin-like domain-containing protein
VSVPRTWHRTAPVVILAEGKPEGALRALLEEHKHFRKKLAELSTAVDLHTLRLEPVRDFVDQLRAHARREDSTLYAFGDEHLSDTDREGVLAALTASRRAGIKRPGPF